ncbi:phosphatase PAP2 family protein [Noviherbaspirillum sp.]|uniref:phosphatase PAP2 family protein n=1 Tax=Noviherbaspirillum sp. TaxID=1926288 RepID=UPI002D5C3FDE|nr:phosphatase PAP2 family protein [Noviherbaspirillum sp.]HZW20828.1 phosphatase PAP2 family protein [Noviherbaspirillum sp.]
MMFWKELTALGDASITLPAAIVIALLLLAPTTRGLALRWFVLFGAMLACVVATKLAFLAWGAGIAEINFTGISGHSSRSAAVWPALAFVLVWNSSKATRRNVVALSFVIAALISASRVIIDAHSLSEALLGFVLGSVVSMLFMQRAAAYQPRPVGHPILAVGAVILVGSALLGPAPTKTWMRELAFYLTDRDEPYSRNELMQGTGGARQ